MVVDDITGTAIKKIAVPIRFVRVVEEIEWRL